MNSVSNTIYEFCCLISVNKIVVRVQEKENTEIQQPMDYAVVDESKKKKEKYDKQPKVRIYIYIYI